MGYIEIFRLNDEGAGWVDLSEATPSELLNLEIGLELDECGGAGFVFYGDEKEFDVKSCDCALETWGI